MTRGLWGLQRGDFAFELHVGLEELLLQFCFFGLVSRFRVGHFLAQPLGIGQFGGCGQDILSGAVCKGQSLTQQKQCQDNDPGDFQPRMNACDRFQRTPTRERRHVLTF